MRLDKKAVEVNLRDCDRCFECKHATIGPQKNEIRCPKLGCYVFDNWVCDLFEDCEHVE